MKEVGCCHMTFLVNALYLFYSVKKGNSVLSVLKEMFLYFPE